MRADGRTDMTKLNHVSLFLRKRLKRLGGACTVLPILPACPLTLAPITNT
jgi:hypothetical protein